MKHATGIADKMRIKNIAKKAGMWLAALVITGAGMVSSGPGCNSAPKLKGEEIVTKSVSKKNTTTTSNTNETQTYNFDAGIYAFQRTQTNGESHPNWIRGGGIEGSAVIGRDAIFSGDTFRLYAGAEYDEKERTSTSPIGRLESESKGTTYRFGLKYNPIDNSWIKIGPYAGLFNRNVEASVDGHVGNTYIDEKEKENYWGTEAGIGANIFGVDLKYGVEDHDLNDNRESANTKKASKFSVGYKVEF